MRWVWVGMLGCGPPSVAEVAERCGDCHVAQAAAFEASPHARAGGSEVFEALRAALPAEDGAGCQACHLPSTGTDRGLSCVSCHAAVGHAGASDGRLVYDPWGGVQVAPGSTARAPHAIDDAGFLAEASLCGTCHDASGPGPFRESPYQHWAASPAADDGVSCQGCHMPKVDGVSGHAPAVSDDPAGWFGPVVSMSWQGEELAVESLHGGHALPDGASFLRRVEVVARREGQTVPWVGEPRWWLSSRASRGGREVELLAADGVVDHHLLPGEVRRRSAGGSVDQVCVVYQRYDPGLVEALGLGPEAAGPVVEVACLSSTGLPAPPGRARPKPRTALARLQSRPGP
jgi:hypothetical protein